MSLKQVISEDLKTAMKGKNTTKLSILRVLKGEIERQEQGPNGKVELADGNIVALVKKLIEGIKETTNDQIELDVLGHYIPRQLTDKEMRDTVSFLKENGMKSVGEFMKHFKTTHDGMYDGKTLSTIIKEVLA